jgi:hypothetical protein
MAFEMTPIDIDSHYEISAVSQRYLLIMAIVSWDNVLVYGLSCRRRLNDDEITI